MSSASASSGSLSGAPSAHLDEFVYDDAIVRKFMVATIVWGFVAMLVGVLIAVLPLVDAGFVLIFGMWPMAVFCVGCAVLSFLGQRWVAGS